MNQENPNSSEFPSNTQSAAGTEKTGPFDGGRLTNGLLWGFDFCDGAPVAVDNVHAPRPEQSSGGFRWLHFNAVDHGSARSIQAADLPEVVCDLLLAHDDHQRAIVDGDYVAGVLHDFERDFDGRDNSVIGALRFAINHNTLLTIRKQPLRCADVVRRRISGGICPDSPSAAFEMLTSSIAEDLTTVLRGLEKSSEKVEDELLTDRLTPDTRELIGMRRRAVQLHRMLTGLGEVCQRLESDQALMPELLPAVENFAQRVSALDHSVGALQSQLRLLRDELELQAAQRTNRSLYVMSILSALMLPATFVTGLFGMNTGGLPWATSPTGTVMATLLAFFSALSVYLVLRKLGFLKV